MEKDNHDIVKINFLVTVKISIATIMLTILLNVLYYMIVHSLKETLLFSGVSAAAAGGVLVAFYTGRMHAFQIHTQFLKDQLDKQSLALRYASRWNEPDMESARIVCREVIQKSGCGINDIQKYLSSVKKELQVIHMLNFLEEIATAVKYKVADEVILKDTYEDAVIAVWRCLEQWVRNYRKDRAQLNAWANIEKLYRLWSVDIHSVQVPVNKKSH